MNSTKRSFLGLGVMVAMMAVTGSAFAVTSPFGNSAVEVRVGRAIAGLPAGQYVMWKRKSDGACQTTLVGNALGLTGPTIVQTGSGGDLIVVQATAEVFSCNGTNITLDQPFGGFQTLSLRGGAGSDVLLAGFPSTEVLGEGGVDIVAGGGGGIFPVVIKGGADGDDVEAWGTANDEQLFGEGGNDCMWDQNAFSGALDCGTSATDNDQFKSSTLLFPNVIVDCETPVSCCSWAHFAGAC